MSPEPGGVPLVMLPARMLADKGVREFVEAARIVSGRGVAARFVLVGGLDGRNPTAISERHLRGWHDEGVVEWWGHRTDMSLALAASNLVVLPSYREGLPKVLLEAAASGRAIVATDVPGCRDVVRHAVTGWLVPPRDAPALAAAIERLLQAPAWRAEAGQRGRELVQREFSITRIARETIDLYRGLLGHAPSDVAAHHACQASA
jgi:glycosyltransferase involved in cell wall biosynthesis